MDITEGEDLYGDFGPPVGLAEGEVRELKAPWSVCSAQSACYS